MRSTLPAMALIGVSSLCLVTASGCGSLGGSGGGGPSSNVTAPPSSYINNEKVERSIEQSVRQQRHRRVVASCPPLVKIKKGGTFTCVAATGRGDARFRVTMKDDKGNVHYATAPQ